MSTAMVAALAAWLSLGVMAFTHAGGHRLAMLPVSHGVGILIFCAAVGAATLVRVTGSRAPLILFAFLFLPWIPRNVPAFFFLWLGPLTLLIWTAVFGIWVTSALRARARSTREDTSEHTPPLPRVPRALPRFPRQLFTQKPAAAAGVIAFFIFSISAWQVSPSIPGGDEPHYLVITQSLVKDGDLRIENNHRRGDYQAYHPRPLPPDFRRRGRDGQIYSIHAPGLPAVVAPAFAIGGYYGVVFFLIMIAAAGSALAWRLAFAASGRTDAAWFGWGAVTLAATTIFHSFSVYPDGPGGVLVLTGLWALLRSEQERQNGAAAVRPWLLHGLGLAALPWLHTRFALLAGTLGALIVLRLAGTKNAAAKAVAFLAIPALSAVLWIGYFVAIYGTPDPAAPYAGEGGSFAFAPGGLTGLLFDQRFGLIAYAPVLALGFVGLGIMIAGGKRRRLAVEILFVLVPYLVTVTHFAMWWGGSSAPARFTAPIVPTLAVPAAICWASIRSLVTRTTAVAVLTFTAFASGILIFTEGGRLAYNSIREPAAWLTRINPVADISGGLPLWSRTADYPLFRDTSVWLLAVSIAWVIAHWGAARLPARMQRGTVVATLTLVVYAAAAMASFIVVWGARGADRISVAPAQVQVLRQIADSPRVLAVDLNALRPVSRDNIPGRLRIDYTRELPSREVPRGALALGQVRDPLFAIRALPAGEYRITPIATEPRGWLMVGVGRDQFALVTSQLSTLTTGFDLRLPAHVGELVVRGDEDARQVVRALRLEPLSILPPGMRSTNAAATRAVRYAPVTVFFIDDASYAEPEAFWVAGAAKSSVVIQDEDRLGALELQVRNAPVENRVSLEAGKWREEMTLSAGEERRVRVPLDGSRDSTLLRFSTSSGFRPSAVDPASRDDRYLGIWVQVAPQNLTTPPK